MASPGDTILVSAGTYYEQLWIEKAIKLVGESGSNTITDGSLGGSPRQTVNIRASNVEVRRFTIENGDNERAIDIVGASVHNVTICENNIRLHKHEGIRIYDSYSNVIADNNVSYNARSGIYLWNSGGNVLRNNRLFNNTFNFKIATDSTYDLFYFSQDIDTSNTVDGKPIYYWLDQHSKLIPQDAGIVCVVSSTKITVRSLNLTRNGHGVLFVNTSDSTIENVTAAENECGLRLVNSRRNILSDNRLRNNTYFGVHLAGSDSSNNRLENYKLTESWFNLHMAHGSSNIAAGNNITNGDYGIAAGGSRNSFHHNNIINNTEQVLSFSPMENNWHHSGLLEGNYWSDYAGAWTTEAVSGNMLLRAME